MEETYKELEEKIKKLELELSLLKTENDLQKISFKKDIEETILSCIAKDIEKAKEKWEAELIIANKKLAYQNEEKEKRAAELVLANIELVFQNEEKEKRAAELVIANKELAYQNEEKEKRAAELIIAKEHAEESDRLKSAFLANMSHEIRTPMNGVLGFAELLKQPKLSSETQQEYINLIEISGERLLNIINDIIDISKIESGQMEVVISETNINEQIENIYKFFKPETEKNRTQLLIKNTLSTKESIIETDKEKVYAILTNLVKNAIKFTQEGSIEFGYEKKEKYLEFYVKDTGKGIANENKEIIFERFMQSGKPYDINNQGTGLGLSISKAYVEILGGKIWVESEEGKGSIFYFTLPYNPVHKENNVVEKTVRINELENHFEPLKILLVEDDDISVFYISTVIKKISREVLYAKNGIEAIELCKNNPDIDLVLMDIQMPRLNGYEATKQIRQFNKDIIIIAQTAFGLKEDKAKAIEAGCTDYISKPINSLSLLVLIQKHFNKYEKA